MKCSELWTRFNSICVACITKLLQILIYNYNEHDKLHVNYFKYLMDLIDFILYFNNLIFDVTQFLIG